MSAREREEYSRNENARREQAESRVLSETFNKEYKPNVELKYVDEFGRHMTQKEAFKQLSHQFHGKGSVCTPILSSNTVLLVLAHFMHFRDFG